MEHRLVDSLAATIKEVIDVPNNIDDEVLSIELEKLS
jgi:hypothetical protein